MNSFLRNLKILILVLTLGGISNQVHATHAAGAEITYRCLGGDTFELTYKFYRDCGGVNPPTAGQLNSGGGTRTFISCTNGGTRTPSWTATDTNDVTPVCNGSNSECNGGTIPGIGEYVFMDTIVLNPQCNNWTIGVRVADRNTSTNITGGRLYVETTIFSTTRRCNASPTFTSAPAPYFCIGQKVNYSYGAIDADGDSLVFSFENPKTGPTTLSTFRTGYSKLQPIPGISINFRNGDLAFTGPTTGTFTLTILISEYDKATGNLLGTIMRDIQVASTSTGCAGNSTPTIDLGGVTNFQDGAAQDSLTVITKAGANLRFDMPFVDANSGDTLTTATNAASALPGTVTTSQIGVGNSVSRRVNWTVPTAATGSFNVTFEARDNNCPINASVSATAVIKIVGDLTSAVITGVKESCFNGDDGSLTVDHVGGIGPFEYRWDSAGVRISANTKTILNIPSNISYVATVVDSFDLDSIKSTGFNLAQTLPVSVAISNTTNISCAGGCSGEINITSVTGGNTTVSGVGVYGYKWSPSGDTIANPKNLCAGEQLVTISDDNDCDTVYSFSVSQDPSVAVEIIDSTDISCKGGRDGDATSTGSISACGVYSSTAAKCSTTTTATVGTGTSANAFNGYPAPIGQLDNAKQQYLYLASELTALGFRKGRISKIAFEKLAGVNPFSAVKNFSLSIGCTDSTSLDSGFVGGLFEVFSSSSYAFNPFITKITVSFNQEFVWDGNTNIVVQICHEQETSGFPSNATTKYTTTAFNSVAYYTSKTANACLEDSATVIIKNRPNIDLLYCDAGITYSWNSTPVQTDSAATGLPAGTYIVTASNIAGCAAKDTVTLTEPPVGLTLNSTIVSTLDCAGDTNGSASIQVTGGSPGFSFFWPTGVNKQAGADSIATNLRGGVKYRVTVEDSKGCEDTITVLLTEPASIVFNNFTLGEVSCKGDNDGSISITPAGGSGVFPANKYLWSPAQTGSSPISNLVAGTYRLTVEDSKGCEADTSFIITEPSDTITFGNFTLGMVACKGASTGSITVNPSGGSGVYTTYAWNPVQTGKTTSLTLLAAGTYRLTVTDNKTCTGDTSFVITEPATGVTFGNSIVDPVKCFGESTGKITVIPTGGAGPPYTNYRWTGTTSTNDTAKNLAVGTYTVTVANGVCDFDTTFSITQPATALNATGTTVISALDCAGDNDGRASVTVRGGTPSYGFAWPTGVTTLAGSDSIAINLSGGVKYKVTVTDANLCEDTITVLLTEPADINFSNFTIKPVSCKGGIDGEITVTPSGGTGIFPAADFIWNPVQTGTTNITGLKADTYRVTVKDSKGCEADTSFIITEPSDTITFGNFTLGMVACKGASTGSITVNPSGGSGVYTTYAWNPVQTGKTTSLTLLAAGTYRLTVTDNKTCTGDTSFVITEPATGVTFGNSIVDPVKCFGESTGKITVIPTGGAGPPYTNYRWTGTTSTNDTAKNLAVGTYTVTVANGVCDFDTTFSITQPATGISASFTGKKNPTCSGTGNNGEIQATVSGGLKPYSFVWLGSGTSSSAADSLRTSMVAGPIEVTVRDANGCEFIVRDTLVSPSIISVSFTMTEEPLCYGDSTGKVYATITGGTGPKMYAFVAKAGQVGSSDSIWEKTTADTITVNVEDSLGCKASSTVVLDQPDSLSFVFQIIQSVSCASDTTGQIRALVTGGTRGYTYNWNGLGATAAADSLRDSIPVGSFQLNVTDNNGCPDSAIYKMTGPTNALTANLTKDTIKCATDTNGTAFVVPSGGAGGYVFNWSAGNGGVNDDTSKFIPAGVFRVTITDANTCELILVDSIGSPDTLKGSFTNVLQPGCGGGGTLGSLTVTPTGGTANSTNPPYTYNWIGGGVNGASDSIRTNIPVGNIKVIISDANGCASDTLSQDLFPPGNINPNFTLIQNPTCNGKLDGRLISTPTGGNQPYTFTWSHGVTGISDSDRTNLPAGVDIIVTIRDGGGCEEKDTIQLKDPDLLQVQFTDSVKILCAGGNNGSVTATPINGVAPYSFNWTTGVSTQTGKDSVAIGLSGNTAYSVTITDDNKCTVSDTIILSEPSGLSLSFSDSIEVKCFNEPDGSITVTPIGGSGIYTYAWNASDGSTVNTLATSDSVAIKLVGNVAYTVVVTDAVGGCSASATYTMDQPTDLRAFVRQRGSATCGDDNGIIRINVFGGVRNSTSPFYNVVWDSAGVIKTGTGTNNIFTLNNLYAGVYTFTATDANGCFMQDTVSVNDRGAPILVPTGGANNGIVDAACNGVCDGEVNLTLVFSRAPVSYLWSNGDTTQDVDSLCVGQYNLVATDTNGCKSFYDFEIKNDTNIDVSTSVSPLSCNSTVCDGVARAQGIDGVAPYKYQWTTSPLDTLDSLPNLCAGKYYVGVQDANGCVAVDSVTLLVPTTFNFTVSQDSARCNGATNGSARVSSVTGGSAPYSYQWSSGANDTLFAKTGLGAGDYFVTVFENGGCSVIDTISVLQPDTIGNSFAVVEADCGFSNGSVTATPVNGKSPYSYNWPNAGATLANTDNGYAGGSYSVLISDARGCTINKTFNIGNKNGPLIVLDSTRNETCVNSCDGAIFTTVTGGNPLYVFDWSLGNGSSDDTTNACAGTYTLKVTDQKNCLSFQSATIDPGIPLLPNASIVNNASAQSVCDGRATSAPTGGSGRYGYNWMPGSLTSQSISGQCAGTYFLTVTDSASGCIGLDTIEITEPNGFALDSTDVKEPTCAASPCDGFVFVSVTGGTPPIKYLWDNGDTTQFTANRCAGLVSVTVSDANSSSTFPFILNNPSGPTIATAKVDISCNGAGDGIGVGIGAAGLTWSWPSLSISNDSATGLTPGLYQVQAEDAAGCITVDTVRIEEPDSLKNTFATVEPNCNASDGSITSNVTGGTINYTYEWLDGAQSALSPPQSGVALASRSSGLYHLRVTDQNGCSIIQPITLNDKNAPVVALDSVRHESCLNKCDGGISVNVSGGAGGNVYSWSPGTNTNEDLTNACASTYTLTVEDAANCKSFLTETIDPGKSLNTNVTKISDASAPSICDGSARVNVAGGVPPLVYSWTSLETIDIATALCGGMNYVTVTDFNSCQAIDSVEILEPVKIILTNIDTTAPKCGKCDGKIKITPSGGLSPYTYKWDNNDTADSTINLCAGIKNVTVTDANLDSAVFQIGLSSQNAPTLAMVENDVSCFGACDGSATVNASGGAAPYSYRWPTIGMRDSTISSLCKGIYLVEVRDVKGCIAVDSAVIDEPLDILVNITTDSADCGQNNGSASVTAVGGTGTLTYKWSTGAGNVTAISGVGAGAYTVEVSDAKCSKTVGFNINNPAGPTITVDTVIDETCIGSCNGAIFITPSGTPGPYTFDWTPSTLTGEDVSGLCAGIYSVKVSDAANCITVVTDTIESPINLGTTITVINNASAFGKCDGKASISILKPGVYKYAWGSGDVGDTARMLCAGVNYVTITNDKGCQYLDSVVINQPQKMIIINVDTDEPDCNVCNGKATVAVTGGTPPYSFIWDNGDAADSTTKRCAGVLFVTVTDSRGYAEIFSLGLNNNLAPKVITSSTDANCFDECSGTASASGSGTLSPYKYNWPSIGKTGPTVSNLCAGSYIVEVSDNVGCVATQTISIGEPTEIKVDVNKVPPACGIANGIIFTSARGGNTASTGYTYSWLGSQELPIVPAQTSDQLINVVAGLYYIVVTDNSGCKDTTSISLDNKGGKLAIGLDSLEQVSCASQCDGAIFTSISGSSPGTYQWIPGGQTTPNISGICAGIYTAEVTDTNNCKTLQSFTVNGPDPLNVVFSRTTDATCENTNDGSITVLVASTQKLRIAWTGPEGFGSNKLKVENLLPGTYTINVTDENSCVSIDSIALDTTYKFILQVDSNRTTCNASVPEKLQVNVATQDFYSTFWYDGTGKLVGKQDTVSVVPLTGENTYTVEVRQDVCIKTDTIVITQIGNLFADAGEDVKMVDGQRITLGGSPSAPENASVLWSPSEGLSAENVKNPVSSATETTVYKLIVGDIEGCFVIDSVVVTIEDKIEINDGFSPNGDGVNDVWEIAVLKDFPDAKVTIFNRWGQTIYETDPYIPWDGTFEGKPISIGTYYYIIDLKDSSVSESVISGPVTVIR